MSDIEMVFAVGVFTFLLLVAGLAFTIYEVPRLTKLGQDADSFLRTRR